MTDIEKSKKALSSENLTCAVFSGEKSFKSHKRGIAPLVELIDSGEDFCGASVADKAIGKAAALLLILIGVSEVYATVMSKGAKGVFAAHGIKHTCEIEADYIINRAGDGMCPMEAAVLDIYDPEAALFKVRETLKALRAKERGK